MTGFFPKQDVQHTRSSQPKWLRGAYASHALYVLMDLHDLLQMGHVLTLLAHEKHASTCPQGTNTESIVRSKQILHSSSVRCFFLFDGSSSSADTRGRRCNHSTNSHNPPPGSERLVTSLPTTVQRKASVLDELAGTSSCVSYKELQCVWNDPKAIIWLNLKDFAIEHHFVSPHF